jgi:hypothetical protein
VQNLRNTTLSALAISRGSSMRRATTASKVWFSSGISRFQSVSDDFTSWQPLVITRGKWGTPSRQKFSYRNNAAQRFLSFWGGNYAEISGIRATRMIASFAHFGHNRRYCHPSTRCNGRTE